MLLCSESTDYMHISRQFRQGVLKTFSVQCVIVASPGYTHLPLANKYCLSPVKQMLEKHSTWITYRNIDNDLYFEQNASHFIHLIFFRLANLSRDMRFPTMRYLRPAKYQTSLRIRAVIKAFASHLNIL